MVVQFFSSTRERSLMVVNGDGALSEQEDGVICCSSLLFLSIRGKYMNTSKLRWGRKRGPQQHGG